MAVSDGLCDVGGDNNGKDKSVWLVLSCCPWTIHEACEGATSSTHRTSSGIPAAARPFGESIMMVMFQHHRCLWCGRAEAMVGRIVYRYVVQASVLWESCYCT